MKGVRDKKYQLIVLIIFIVCTVLSFGMAINIIRARVDSKKSSAKYTAESTTRRIKSEIETYYVSIEILENYLLQYGEKELIENFERLSETMLDSNGIIKGIELAKDGIVSNVYPYNENKEALGLDLLKDENRKIEANVAKDSGEYTMAGPFGLRQSNEGVLLLNPVYIDRGIDEKVPGKEFWGFTVVVIDWEKFIKQIKLDKLEETGYLYKIWRNNPYSDDIYVLAKSSNEVKDNAIKVPCNVPNDTWYVEIAPRSGWYLVRTMIQQIIITIMIPILGTVGIWMYLRCKHKEDVYNIKLEQARSKAEAASEAKTRFLCTMSHDIRTPMNAVLGFTKIASENVNDTKKVKESLKKIDTSGRHLLNLINEVLNFSNIESGVITSNITKQNMHTFGEELKIVFEQDMCEKGIEFNVGYDIKDSDVICDAHHLREICMNLLSNAMKFTPKGGKVTCNIKQLDYIDKTVAKDNSYSYGNDLNESKCEDKNKCLYEIEISDTGIGMSKEFQKKQYQMFERESNSTVSHTEGTGLGLSIVKRLVDLLEGEISCISTSGKGTTYKLRFIFEVAHTVELEEVAQENKAITKGKKVLLVEDVELNKEIAEYVLENMGFDVEHAEDGKKAVDMISYADSDYYDIVLMDIQMPIMNGYEATRKIRALNDSKKASLPIYAMTANAFEEDKKCALDAGMNGHFAKPLDVEKIHAVLSSC